MMHTGVVLVIALGLLGLLVFATQRARVRRPAVLPDEWARVRAVRRVYGDLTYRVPWRAPGWYESPTWHYPPGRRVE